MNPTKLEREGETHGAMKSAETEIIRRVARSDEELCDQLLEGIPNDVVLSHIASRLPRRAYQEIAKLNPAWQRAFGGRMVYDSRVRSQKMQLFFIVRCRVSVVENNLRANLTFKDTLSLFSPSEESWYKFPPIPGCGEGMVHDCSYVLLDCSIYLLGGNRSRPKNQCEIPSTEVLVLDLARHPLEWRLCAKMLVPRRLPAIGVMHGKIFVFGDEYPNFGNPGEVYDPKVDIWSFITPMPSASIFSVFSVDQQVFACTGWRRFAPLLTPNLPVEPPSNVEADVSCDTKFVVKIGDNGPTLTSTNDADEEDDMDGLHKTIENFVDLGKGAGSQGSPGDHLADQMKIRGGAQPWAPADLLASQTTYSYRSQSEVLCFGLYDPVKDEWEVFDRERFLERFGRDVNVDLAPDLKIGPKDLGTFRLVPPQEYSWDNWRLRQHINSAEAFVWPLSL